MYLLNFIFQNLQRNDLGEVVILDADNNTIETPFDDLENLPTDVVSINSATSIFIFNLKLWNLLYR